MLYNHTRKVKISTKIVHCTNFYEQGTGLVFRTRKAVDDTAWIFSFDTPRKISLTMFLVFFSIDVIFLDKDKRVVEIKERFLPFAFYHPKHKANHCIELAQGSIKKYQIAIGDRLEF